MRRIIYATTMTLITVGLLPTASAQSITMTVDCNRGQTIASRAGLILVDTKYEFGLAPGGHVILIDEVHTPDSSRFWPADSYAPGAVQPSFDKQFVRDYCESLGWDKTDPGPELPEDVVAGTRARYVEAFERLTERSFDAYLDDPESVLR